MPPKAGKQDSLLDSSKLAAECKAVSDALAQPEAAKQKAGLIKLLELPLNALPEGALDVSQTLHVLLRLLGSPDLAVQQGASLAVARLCQSPEVSLAVAVFKEEENFQVLWSVLQGYETALRTAPSTPPTLTSTSKSGKGEQLPVIPGPDKLVLESLLKAATSLASSSIAVVERVYANDLQPLLALLMHPIARVQAATLRMLYSIARMPRLHRGLVLSGVVKLALPLCTSPAIEVKVLGLKLLERMTNVGGIQQVELSSADAPVTLVNVLLNPHVEERPATSAPAKAGKVPEPQGPSPMALEDIQVQCLMVLSNMCRHDRILRAKLAGEGLVQVLAAFLPDPPPKPAEQGPDGTPRSPTAPRSQNTIFSALVGSSRPSTANSELVHSSRDAMVNSTNQSAGSVAYELPHIKTTSHRMTTAILGLLSSILDGEGLISAQNALPQLLDVLTYLLQKPAVAPPAPAEEECAVELADGKQGSKAKAPNDAKSKGKEDTKPKAKDDKKSTSKKVLQPEAPPITAAPLPHLVPPFPTNVHAAVLQCLSGLCPSGGFMDLVLREAFLEKLPTLVDFEDDQIAAATAALHMNLLHHWESLVLGDPEVRGSIVRNLQQLSHRSSVATDLFKATLAHTSMKLDESMLTAPARPPLPSPPSTPPPAPLATTQYLWDALGRPLITDGVLLEVAN